MKAIVVILLILMAAAAVNSQTKTASTKVPSLEIVRVELQRTVVKAPALRAVAATDPAAQQQARDDRAQDADPDRDPALHRMSQNAEVAPKTTPIDTNGKPRVSREDPIGRTSTGNSVVYVASIVVKNIGTKRVTSIEWEYMLFETGAKAPVKSYKIRTKRTIPPGEQAELTKEVTPKGQEHQARITRIEYSDHTYWEP